MAFIYTRGDYQSRINAGIQGKKGILIDFDETANQAVRQCFAKLDFRSARRKAALTPGLYNGIFDYVAPTDLHSLKIIDLPAQAKRADGHFFLVPTETFSVRQQPGMVAVKDFNGVRAIQVASRVDSNTFIISELDALTSGGGTWAIFGDAESLAADSADFVKGNGSLAFDISSAGGTTAGIQNSSLNAFDLSDYFDGTSAIFVWVRINSATNLTNFILRFGTDASNYYSKTVTARHDGTAFTAGWNLIRFDISSLTQTGSPDNTDLSYVALYMTKDAAKVSESDYKFDYLAVKKGVPHDIEYYTKYGWQNSSGTYIANSSADTDLLVADDDEYEVLIAKGVEVAAREIRDPELVAAAERHYKEVAADYVQRNPSEAKIITSDYLDFIK